MKNYSSTARATIYLLATIFFAAIQPQALGQASGSGNPAFEHLFTEEFSSIEVENLTGRIQVETWNSRRVRITANTDQPLENRVGALDGRVLFVKKAPDSLNITVKSDAGNRPVELKVYVPPGVSLSIRGGDERVIIKGATGAMSVETNKGDVSLHLPAAASTDLSLRAVEGSITSQLPLAFFGPVNAHALDGRTGKGGPPVIIRSMKGSIELLQDDSSHLVQAEGAPAKDSGGDGSSVNEPKISADDVLKVDIRLVNLNARVTDAAGKLIPDLTKDDFLVFENNVEQEVTHFEPVTAPVNLVLLLDVSSSTKDRMKVMKKAAKKFIESLSPNTRISVAAFTRKFVLISNFTDDRKLLKDRIDDINNFKSGTAFYDSMWSTLDLLDEVEEKRKAVVVLTDGVDNSLSYDDYTPRHSFEELLARMSQEDVTVYPIYFDTEYEVTVKLRGRDTHEAYVTARKQLQRIADDTGGTLYRADRAEDLEGVYQRIASELHTLYSIAYRPKDINYDGQWRNLSVKLKNRPGVARTKRGFYAK